LMQCNDCANVRRTLEQIVQGLGDLGPAHPRPGMRDRLRDRLREQSQPE
jgi:hypothetical protein